jgi:hypothetical protein
MEARHRDSWIVAVKAKFALQSKLSLLFPKQKHEDIAMSMTGKTKSKYRFSKNTWLGDSAASTHMGNCDEGMFDVEVISSQIKIGDGKALTPTKIGKK